VLEIAEDALREIDGDARDAHDAGAELGLGAHALRDGEGPMHAAREVAAQRARGDRGVVSVLHLAEDLRLAEDHRVEARGHTEDVTDRGVPALLVEPVGEIVGAGGADLLAQRLTDGARGGARGVLQVRAGLGQTDDLDAIARGEEHRLLELGARGEPRE